MEAKIEKPIKDIITTLHRYEQSELGLTETLQRIKVICDTR